MNSKISVPPGSAVKVDAATPKRAAWDGGKCCVPMWANGCPDGHCGERAFGPQLPQEVLFWDRSWQTAPYCYGPCCPKHGGPNEGDAIIFRDGLTDDGRPMWCAVSPTFVDLQVSAAGFDRNPLQARINLRTALAKERAQLLALPDDGATCASTTDADRAPGTNP